MLGDHEKSTLPADLHHEDCDYRNSSAAKEAAEMYGVDVAENAEVYPCNLGCEDRAAAQLTDSELHDMTRGYITAALWADAQPWCETCNGDGMLERPNAGGYYTCPACEGRGLGDEFGGLDGLDVTPESYVYAFELCRAFCEAAGDDLRTFYTGREPSDPDQWGSVGHDLRLTSGGHGAGFWDREHADARNPEGDGGTIAAFQSAKARLSALARSRPFDRSGGGDVWQVYDDTCEFDPLSLDPDATPGELWRCPVLTRAQRQAWTLNGRIPNADPRADLLHELRCVHGVLEQGVGAAADPAPVGDFQPVQAAARRMKIAAERLAAVIDTLAAEH